MAKMTIEELIQEFSNEQGFQFGIDIVMKSLRPGALYGLSASGGTFEIIYRVYGTSKTKQEKQN
jgi:hypothetical protein